MNDCTGLLNGYCHLVNKTILFVNKYFEGIVPAGRLDQDIYWRTKGIYEQVEAALEQGRRREAQRIVEEYLEFANDYFDQGRPWETCRTDRRSCRNTVLNTLQMVANLTVLMELFAEYPSGKVNNWFQLGHEWQVHSIHSGYELPRTESLAMLDAASLCI